MGTAKCPGAGGLGLTLPPAERTCRCAADLDQTFSKYRGLASFSRALHNGIVPSSCNLTPKETIDEFYRRDPQGDINRIYSQVMREAPSLKQARQIWNTQRDLDQGKLDLSYVR